MPVEKFKSELKKLSNILVTEPIADQCTASELQKIHDQFQDAIKSGDPAQQIREKKLEQQLIMLEEANPVLSKVLKDISTALSGMGI